MSKKTFQNLPNTTTPLNAANLNEIQENMVEYKTFEISVGGSKSLTHNTSSFVLLLSAKGGQGGAQSVWLIAGSGAGTSSRDSVIKLHDYGSRELTYTITDQTITLTNPNTTIMYCSIVFLVGSLSQITVS